MDKSKLVKSRKVKKGDEKGFLINCASPALAQKVLEIMGEGTRVTHGSDGLPILSIPGDEEGIKARMRSHIFGMSTVERNAVIVGFAEAVKIVQRANTFEEFMVLADDIDDDFGMQFGMHPLPEVDLCEENRVDIQTLYDVVHEQLEGKFLLCRTISGAMNGTWLEAVVEDPSGKAAAILRLKNFTPPIYSLEVTKAVGGTRKDWFEWLPSGSYIAVKNTFASVAKLKVHGILQAAVICCFNPAEVVLLSSKKMMELFPELVWKGFVPGVPFWDSAGRTDAEIMDTLKGKGNTAFATKRYTDALRWYDLALEYSLQNDTGFTNILSNKAAAFIGLSCFQRALMSCDQILVLVPNHVKAIYRKMKALIGLGRMDEAETFLKDKFTIEPALMENEDLRGLMEKFNKTLEESVEDFDFSPDYIGPIECRSSSSASCRGVFATEDISPGQLLLSHRCFAHVGERNDWDVERNINPISNKLVGNELIGIIANKLAFSPELGKDIYKLWAGNELKVLDGNGDCKVILSRIQNIVAKNAIFASNHYHPGNAAGVSTFGAQLDRICVDANVMISSFQPFFKLRATKFIKKGESLLLRYYIAHHRMQYKKQMLQELDRTCNCRSCRHENRQDPRVLHRLDNLCVKLDSIEANDYDANNHKVDSSLEIVRQIERVYADAPDLNIMMLDTSIRNTLCDALFKRGSFQDYVTLCEKIFTVAKTVSEEVAMDAATNVMRGYLKLNNKSKAIKWFKRWRECCLIIYGSAHGLPFISTAQLIGEMKYYGIDVWDLQ